MTCTNCGNKNAYAMRFRANEITGKSQGHCNACGSFGGFKFSDVYFRAPYFDPHLVDTNKPEQKDGVWIETREQKAKIMKDLKVREAGDKAHGARNVNKNLSRSEASRYWGLRD